MNLEQFLASRLVNHSYIKEPGFDELYIRKGMVTFSDKKNLRYLVRNVLIIARVVATHPCQGSFTRFWSEAVTRYQIPIYVECVLSDRFCEYLIEHGFDKELDSDSFLIHWRHHARLVNPDKQSWSPWYKRDLFPVILPVSSQYSIDVLTVPRIQVT